MCRFHETPLWAALRQLRIKGPDGLTRELEEVGEGRGGKRPDFSFVQLSRRIDRSSVPFWLKRMPSF